MALLSFLSRSLETRRKPARGRRLRLETLDPRAMLAVLPYGAMPDDTGEFMLGDVYVTVVLMESNGALDPSTENWTSAQEAAVQTKVTDGVDWWKDTLYQQFPNTPPNMLNFEFNWDHLNAPVPTKYEPIDRPSYDVNKWIYDFLTPQGYSTGNISSDIRAFNHAQRIEHGAEWAFTIFVVNDANDADGKFAQGDGSGFRWSFAYPGGQFFVMPAARPAQSAAHETGHMFWAMDEYLGGNSYTSSRGYYNTPNANAANNPAGPQVASIMTNDVAPANLMSAAYNGNTSSPSTLAMIGWQDTDDDGIMDVLDVPMSLTGDGWYQPEIGVYNFSGKSAVRTLQNRNPEGLQDDITINHIRQAQYKIDGGEWQVAQEFDDSSAYSANLDLSFAVPAGDHEVRIRTYDTRTHVASDEFVGHTTSPSSIGDGGVSGYVWYDANQNGIYDSGETPAGDFGIELVNAAGQPINLRQVLIGSNASEGALPDEIVSGATFTPLGSDVQNSTVRILTSSLTGQKVFSATSNLTSLPVTAWTQSTRNLRIDFDTPTTTVSLRAIGASAAGSFGRLDAYNASSQLVGRYTTSALGFGIDETMTVTRTSGDIKYVVARVFQTGGVELTDLAWGARTSATTNLLGAYSLPDLPAGTYYIHPLAGPLYISTTYPGGNPPVNLAVSGSSTINFGYQLAPNPWHNPVKSEDVNADGNVDILDVLQIISWIRQHYNDLTLSSASVSSNYLDVNYDGKGDISDVLAVIQKIRSQYRTGGGEGELAALTSAPPVAPPMTGYFNGQPIHFTNIPGDGQLYLR